MIAQKGKVQSQSALEIKPIRNGYKYPCKPAGYQNKLFGAVSLTDCIEFSIGLD